MISRTTFLAVLFSLSFILPLHATETDASVGLLPYSEAAPGCASEVEVCFGIVLWMATQDDTPVQTPTWLAAQMERANHHFAGIDVGFELAEIRAVGDESAVIDSREARDMLGRERWTRDVIHVFIVRQLDNVDEEGQIYGVHWRDREDTGHRWVIVSAAARSLTLVHELGHYFGLPHSEYHVSLMNKSVRAILPADLTFHEDEYSRMRRMVDRRLANGRLVNRNVAPDE